MNPHLTKTFAASLPWTQCAAVTTYLEATTVPPQKWSIGDSLVQIPVQLRRATIHGYSLTWENLAHDRYHQYTTIVFTYVCFLAANNLLKS